MDKGYTLHSYHRHYTLVSHISDLETNAYFLSLPFFATSYPNRQLKLQILSNMNSAHVFSLLGMGKGRDLSSYSSYYYLLAFSILFSTPSYFQRPFTWLSRRGIRSPGNSESGMKWAGLVLWEVSDKRSQYHPSTDFLPYHPQQQRKTPTKKSSKKRSSDWNFFPAPVCF